MTVKLDTVFLVFNIGMVVFGFFSGVVTGWLLHSLRVDRNTERLEREEDERRREAGVVASDAWLWACEAFPENRDARSAACEGYNAGAERRKPKGNGP